MPSRLPLPPCALAIGGLDPGGGAGIAADLRAFHAVGVFGCAAVAVVTVQSTDGLVAAVALQSKLVVRQAAEVVRAQRVRAIKLGALGSLANVQALARWLAKHQDIPLVLDPVLLPTRGTSRLLAAKALGALREQLLPRATLVTANAPEASQLTERPVTNVAQATAAAEKLVALGAQAALVKGGHLAGREAVDVLCIQGRMVLLRSKRLPSPPFHGGGCILASLIAGRLARLPGLPSAAQLERAVVHARRLHQRALAHPLDVGGALRVLAP